jgi:hypothetical protein
MKTILQNGKSLRRGLTILMFLLSFIITYYKISSINSTIHPDKNKNKCLEMHGIIKQANEYEFEEQYYIERAQITILSLRPKKTESVYSNHFGECHFRLELNNEYIIKISKKGWLTKTINIDTRLSQEKTKRYHLYFDTEMFEDIKGVNVSALNSAIANVDYNEYLNNFDYNYKYTDEVNRNIKKLYSDYYAYRKKKGSKKQPNKL